MKCDNCEAEADTLVGRAGSIYVCAVCVPEYDALQLTEDGRGGKIERAVILLSRIEDMMRSVLNPQENAVDVRIYDQNGAIETFTQG